MKIPTVRNACSRALSARAFTLTNALVALSIFSMVVIGIVTSHQFGMQMMDITRSRVNTSDDSRRTLNWLTTEIRSAKSLKVGSGSLTAFTPAAPNSRQEGNAIQLYFSSDTSEYVRYFRDAGDRILKRRTSASTDVMIIAEGIRNEIIFTAEDYSGAILSNRQNNCILALDLEFDSLDGGTVPIGPSNYFKSYELHTKIAHRAIE